MSLGFSSLITERFLRWEIQQKEQEKTRRCVPLRHIESPQKIETALSRRQLYESGAQNINLC